MADIFISYSRSDREFVRKLHTALVDVQQDTWVDWEDIPPTVEWLKEIFTGIDAADTFLFIVSPESVASATCRQELDYAFKNNKKLVPLLLHSVNPADLPSPVAPIQWITFVDSPFEKAFGDLMAAVETDIEWRRAHTRLLLRAIEWERQACDPSFLLRGKDLEEVEHWLASIGPKEEPRPTELQSKYVLASQDSQRHEEERWKALYEQAERERRLAFAEKLAAQSRAHLDDSLDLSLLLSREAFRACDTFEARSAIVAGLQHYPHIERYLRGQLGQGPIGARSIRSAGLSVSPDGRMLAGVGGGLDSAVAVWEVKSGNRLATLSHEHPGAINALAYSPDGKILASGGQSGELTLWDLASSRPIRTAASAQDGGISAIAFHPGRRCWGWSTDTAVCLWDSRNDEVQVLRAPSLRYLKLFTFVPDSALMIAGGYKEGGNDEVTVFVDIRTGREAGKPLTGTLLALSSDGKRIAVAAADGRIEVYDALSRNLALPVIEVEPSQRSRAMITAAAFAPSGSALAVSVDQEIALYDLTSGKPMGDRLIGHRELIDAIVFISGAERLASLASDDAVILWNAPNRRSMSRVFVDSPDGWGVAFNPCDGSLACTGTKTTVWDVAKAAVIATWDTPDLDSAQPALSADGTCLAVSQGVDDYTKGPAPACLFDLRTKTPILNLPAGDRGGPLALSPQGTTAAFVIGETQVGFFDWETHTITVAAISTTNRISVLAFSPSNQLAIGDVQGQVTLWDLSTGQPADLDKLDDGVRSLSFDRTGNALLATSSETAVLWDIGNRRRVRKLVHASAVGAPAVAAFEPNGLLIAWSTFAWPSIQVLDNKLSRAFCNPLEVEGGGVLDGSRGLAFSPDGRILATSGNNGVVFWDFDVGSWIRRASALANRDLTVEEWDRYMGNLPYPKP